jgi:hypothetical protein
MTVGNIWIVRCRDGSVVVTLANERPKKDSESEQGYLLGYPGTADIESDYQMYSMFGILYQNVRAEIETLPIPPRYSDEPLEISLKIKSTYYA